MDNKSEDWSTRAQFVPGDVILDRLGRLASLSSEGGGDWARRTIVEHTPDWPFLLGAEAWIKGLEDVGVGDILANRNEADRISRYRHQQLKEAVLQELRVRPKEMFDARVST